MRLSELLPGQAAVIVKVLGHGAFRRRILEMGFIRGKLVTAVLDAPLKDPVKYKIMDYEVSLRRSEAAMIEVLPESEAELVAAPLREAGSNVTYTEVEHTAHAPGRSINVALVGNPNSGKSSLFNAATGSRQHVGNYGGVTVDAKRGSFEYKGYRMVFYDLPGTYALSAYSPEELFVREHLVAHSPDVVVNVVAASNLERNLYLTTDLIDMDCTMVMALNMYDELEKSGARLDCDALGDLLGMPVVPTVSRSGEGIDKLLDSVIAVYENREPKVRHIHVEHKAEIEAALEVMECSLHQGGSIGEHFSHRYYALKMLEGDRQIDKMLSASEYYPQWAATRDEQRANLERLLGEDFETAVTNDKYGFIAGALKETFTPGAKEELNATQAIDSFVTNRLFGFPIFILLMWLMFEATFRLGAYPMHWIESGVAALGDLVGRAMADGMLKDLLTDGIIGGVGGVVVFLPNILILYLFISFMEDSGYMARAAFIMDKIMHRMGLHGKSFIPLIMGFGCNVPAIMAARTVESRSSRLITILINPFMSCSARLPVYILLVGAFFPQYGALVMIALYLVGIMVAVVTAKLLRRFLFRKEDTPFVMELPPYRMPTLRATLSHMWEKAARYLRKMGGIILVASIAVWFLSYFPRHENDSAVPLVVTDLDFAPAVILDKPTGVNVLASETDPEQEHFEQQKNSYIGRIGRFVAPVMQPLGFDWKQSVALISGAAAKEIVVSTLGVLYPGNEADRSAPLGERLKQPEIEGGQPGFTALTALAFMVFALLYFPCLAALAAIAGETGRWKWALFSFLYNTLIAWIAAWIVYRIGSFFL